MEVELIPITPRDVFWLKNARKGLKIIYRVSCIGMPGRISKEKIESIKCVIVDFVENYDMEGGGHNIRFHLHCHVKYELKSVDLWVPTWERIIIALAKDQIEKLTDDIRERYAWIEHLNEKMTKQNLKDLVNHVQKITGRLVNGVSSTILWWSYITQKKAENENQLKKTCMIV